MWMTVGSVLHEVMSSHLQGLLLRYLPHVSGFIFAILKHNIFVNLINFIVVIVPFLCSRSTHKDTRVKSITAVGIIITILILKSIPPHRPSFQMIDKIIQRETAI